MVFNIVMMWFVNNNFTCISKHIKILNILIVSDLVNYWTVYKYVLLVFFRDLKIENLLLDESKNIKIIGEWYFSLILTKCRIFIMS